MGLWLKAQGCLQPKVGETQEFRLHCHLRVLSCEHIIVHLMTLLVGAYPDKYELQVSKL